MHLCICVNVGHMHASALRDHWHQIPEAGVRGRCSCEPLDAGAGNGTQASRKVRQALLQSHLASPADLDLKFILLLFV